METERPRILVVDDDEGTRRILTLMLERKGFDVETAATGQDALEKTEHRPFGLVLLDLMLPDMQGVELLEPLKARHPDVEVIMVTGHASTETAIHALNAGAAAYITKPLNMDEVLAEVRRIKEKQELVAEKRAAQKELRRREAQYRSLFEGVPIGLYRTTPDGQILHANQALVDMLGYPDRATLLETNASELYVNREHRELEMDLVAKDGVVRGFETRFRRHDGSVIWVRETAHVRHTVGGHPVAYEGGLEDITEWKETERALEASEQRYRAIFANTGTATVILEEDTTISLANAQFAALSGYLKEEIEGQKSWTEFVTPEDLERMRTYHRERRRNGGAAPKQYEFQFIDRHGEIKDILITIDVIPGTKKSVASLLDITERKRAEEAVRAQLRYSEALLEINKAISSTLDLDRVLDTVLEELQGVLPFERASVFLLSEGMARVAAAKGYPDPDAAMEVALPVESDPLAQEMIEAQRPVVLRDAQADERFLSLGGTEYVHSWIGVPLIAQGETVGFLTLDHSEKGVYDDESATKASSFAHQAAVAIQKAQLFEQAQAEIAQREQAEAELAQTVEELRLVNETVVAASHLEEPQAICRLVAEATHAANPEAYACVFLHDPEQASYTIRAIGGTEHQADAVFEALGGDPRQLAFPSDGLPTVADLAATGRLERVPEGLAAFACDQLPSEACGTVEALLDASDVYLLGFASTDDVEGGVALLVPEGVQLRHPSAIETIANQVSVMLQGHRAQDQLRRSQGLLKATQRLMQVGGWEWDVEQKRMHWTEETYRIHGLDPADFAPGSQEHIAKSVACYDAEDRLRISKAFERCVEEGEPYDMELPITAAEGERKWVRTVANPVKQDGRIVKVVGSFADITEQRELERQLRQQERIAAVGQLAGGIAHDFRNFLTTIILYAGLGLRYEGTDPSVQDALKTIATEAQRASDLVQQILDFSGRAAMEARSIDLLASVEETAGLLRQTLPESVHIEVAAEPATYVVEADPTRMQQLLMNLALNAWDAMPSGGELRISLSPLDVAPNQEPPVAGMGPGRWVQMTVVDTGEGMTEEVANHIFEPFFTTKEEGAGTGLGLAQVYGIVQKHEGAIDVETQPGQGTTFYVYLPRLDGHVAEEVEKPGSVPQGRGEMVLLVEDRETVRKAGAAILSSLGYRLATAEDGQDALDVLEGFSVDVIVTDIVMPRMGGQALMAELMKRGIDVPVVAMTGYTIRSEMDELAEAGFAQVLHKPLDGHNLAQTVRRALDRGVAETA